MKTVTSRLARLAAATGVALSLGAVAAGPASAAWTAPAGWWTASASAEDGAGSDALILGGASEDGAETQRWYD